MNNKKHIILGFILGVISTGIGVLLYIAFFSRYGVEETLKKAIQFKFVDKIVSLGALLNLGLFFLFLNRKKDDMAKGVLIATLIIGLIIIINRL
ncbi:hypothetical protein [Olleya marilimosa]|uniref:Uncharacterized protein n=1 Tax=Olleya marilimosa TaxID=272164 RepID=A0ABR8LV15_9FLAO|nr:hypothetical protein [Olleya marilimosa]MBD3864021.1 hypothetical protein [Olleya marilimosa]